MIDKDLQKMTRINTSVPGSNLSLVTPTVVDRFLCHLQRRANESHHNSRTQTVTARIADLVCTDWGVGVLLLLFCARGL